MITRWQELWPYIGALGAFLFFARWVLQAYYTYRLKRSHLPVVFWYISIAASIMLAAYAAIYLGDAIFTLTNLAGILIYAVNIFYLNRGIKC